MALGTGISSINTKPPPFVISKNNVPKSVPPECWAAAQGCGFPWRCRSIGMVRGIGASTVWEMGCMPTSGVRTAPSTLLVEGPGTKLAHPSLCSGSITESSWEEVFLLGRTRMFPYPSGTSGLCTAPLTHTDPQLLLADFHQYPACSWPHRSALQPTDPLVAFILKPDTNLPWQVGAAPCLSQFTGNPNNSHHRWRAAASPACLCLLLPAAATPTLCFQRHNLLLIARIPTEHR